MAKKTAFTLAALFTAALLSAPLMAAKPDDKGKPDNGKGPDANGVISIPVKDGEPAKVINTGQSDQEPGPSPA